jgi:hypothetical protein
MALLAGLPALGGSSILKARSWSLRAFSFSSELKELKGFFKSFKKKGIKWRIKDST